jgi:hypothetical protein
MYENLALERHGDVFVLTLQKPPENRLTSYFCQEIIRALNDVRKEIGQDSPGAVIIRGNDAKFFCTVRSLWSALPYRTRFLTISSQGLDLYERDTNPYASSEGFYPVKLNLPFL